MILIDGERRILYCNAEGGAILSRFVRGGAPLTDFPVELAERIGSVASIAGDRYRVRSIPLKARRCGAPLILLLIEKIRPKKESPRPVP